MSNDKNTPNKNTLNMTNDDSSAVKSMRGRVLARVLAEDLKKVWGGVWYQDLGTQPASLDTSLSEYATSEQLGNP